MGVMSVYGGKVGQLRFLLEISFLVKLKKSWVSLSQSLSHHNKLPFEIKHSSLISLIHFKDLFHLPPTDGELQGIEKLSPASVILLCLDH